MSVLDTTNFIKRSKVYKFENWVIFKLFIGRERFWILLNTCTMYFPYWHWSEIVKKAKWVAFNIHSFSSLWPILIWKCIWYLPLVLQNSTGKLHLSINNIHLFWSLRGLLSSIVCYCWRTEGNHCHKKVMISHYCSCKFTD